LVRCEPRRIIPAQIILDRLPAFPREAEAEKVWVPLADIDPLFDIV
jgi:hypothetical protein